MLALANTFTAFLPPAQAESVYLDADESSYLADLLSLRRSFALKRRSVDHARLHLSGSSPGISELSI
jgi:hypothetical protein